MQFLTLEKRQQGGNSTPPRCHTLTRSSDTPGHTLHGTKQSFLEGLRSGVHGDTQGQFVKRVLPAAAPRGDERLCMPQVLWAAALEPSRKSLQRFQECEAEAGPKIRLCTQQLLSASRLVSPAPWLHGRQFTASVPALRAFLSLSFSKSSANHPLD